MRNKIDANKRKISIISMGNLKTKRISTSSSCRIFGIKKFVNIAVDNKSLLLLNKNAADSFHIAISPVMIIGQCFSIMPLAGLLKNDPHYTRFCLFTPGMVFFLAFLVLGGTLYGIIVKYLFSIGLNAKNMVAIIFYSCGMSATILFAFLAREWPDIIKYWSQVERTFLSAPYLSPRKKLKFRIRLAAFLVIFFSLVEHSMYFLAAIYSYNMRTKLCGNGSSPNFDEFIIIQYPQTFSVISYSTFYGILLLILNGIFTFIWNYMDLFVIMISLGIAIRFEQINVRIAGLAGQAVEASTWREIREHYIKVWELLEMVDTRISSIILLSCTNNLYFICYQLLNIFNELRWKTDYVYFWYSLLYLIGRTTALCLCAATINDESKSSLKVLQAVPTELWSDEIERFITSMLTQPIALSGKKFFFLTRKFLFGMAGTIVTYELVLLQFDEANRKKGLGSLCG